MIRNSNIGLDQWVNEIKNGIHQSRLGWFGHVMQMKEEMMPKKMCHTKMKQN